MTACLVLYFKDQCMSYLCAVYPQYRPITYDSLKVCKKEVLT